MDWPSISVAMLSGAVCVSIGALVKSYATKRGETLAAYGDRETILATARATTYEQKKGERLATAEDIQKILHELELVTEKTEIIKSEIGEAFWLRQTVWGQRRDCYYQLVDRATELYECIEAVRMGMAIRELKGKEEVADRLISESYSDQKMTPIVEAALTARTALVHEIERSRIFLSVNAETVLDAYPKVLRGSDHDSIEESGFWLDAGLQVAYWRGIVVRFAHQDLTGEQAFTPGSQARDSTGSSAAPPHAR